MTELQLEAASDQRVGFIGQTRMGKTTAVEQLLADQPRVIVIDSKGRVRWKGFHLTDNPVAALMADKVIYRPANGRPPREWWREAVESLVDRGGGIIYVDEMSYITGPNQIDPGLADGFRLGGELGVGIWYSAQEATTVHNTTMRQSGMLVLFYNQGETDREKLAKIVGDMAHVTRNLPPWQFVVYVQGETYDGNAIPVYRVEVNNPS